MGYRVKAYQNMRQKSLFLLVETIEIPIGIETQIKNIADGDHTPQQTAPIIKALCETEQKTHQDLFENTLW